MNRYTLTVEEYPSHRDAQFIIDNVYRYNRDQTQTNDKDVKRLAIFLRDSRNHVVGGILGWVYWGWFQIEFLWIQEDLRGKGYGKNLMVAAEKKALAMGCHHAYLETFSFQATDFYKKLGYEIFGILEGFPGNHNKYYFRKRLG